MEIFNEPENLPHRLTEEIINYLYVNNLCVYNDFKLLSHSDFCISPVPVVKSLFDKANFYNIAIQKLFILASKDRNSVIEMAEEYFSNHVGISSLIALAKSTLNNTRIDFCIQRNDFQVDSSRKFIYLTNTDLYPSQIHFADNQFYSFFSNKYPSYFNKENNPFYCGENSLSPTAGDNLCSSIIEAMKLFVSEVNKKKLEKLKGDEEGETPKLTPSELVKFEDTMVLFICKESEENNRLEQLSLINELYKKQ